MKSTMTSAALAALLLSANAAAQEAPSEPAGAESAPLRVEVVFSRFQGERKVASLPYTLSVNADDRPARVRMGIQVPLQYASKDAPGNVVYKSVGTNLDCQVRSLKDGRYKMNLTLEQSSVHASEVERRAGASGPEAPTPPVLRTFNSEAGLVLRDGQTAQYTVATDPVTGEVLRVEVTLTVLK